MTKGLLLLAGIMMAMASIAQTGKVPVKVTDMLMIRSISGVNLSHDGSKALFTVTTIEPDGEAKWEYKYLNQVWMVGTDGVSRPKQLTTKDAASQAVFSPDGKQIAFVRTVNE